MDLQNHEDFIRCLDLVDLDKNPDRIQAFDAFKHYNVALFREEIALVVAAGLNEEQLCEVYIRLLPELRGLFREKPEEVVYNVVQMCDNLIKTATKDRLGFEPLFMLRNFKAIDDVCQRFCFELDHQLGGKGREYYRDYRADVLVRKAVDDTVDDIVEILRSLTNKPSSRYSLEESIIATLREALLFVLDDLRNTGVIDHFNASVDRDVYSQAFNIAVEFSSSQKPFARRYNTRITPEALGL